MSIKDYIARRKQNKNKQRAFGSPAWLEALPESYARSEFPAEYAEMKRKQPFKFRFMP